VPTGNRDWCALGDPLVVAPMRATREGCTIVLLISYDL
jgi:hypothetical protein